MTKRFIFLLIGFITCISLSAQPAQFILSQEDGRITFTVDEVDTPKDHCGWEMTGDRLASELNINTDGDLFSDWNPDQQFYRC